jgi:hypothetical protein
VPLLETAHASQSALSLRPFFVSEPASPTVLHTTQHPISNEQSPQYDGTSLSVSRALTIVESLWLSYNDCSSMAALVFCILLVFIFLLDSTPKNYPVFTVPYRLTF